ncbi:MAG TPA: glycosyltransferase family 39 protein [bacterium]|nr:glycosyltransferase family 39 protein [bacterium]
MERQQKDRKIILILFFTSLLVRLIFVLALEKRFYFPDEEEYFRMIENFFSGRGLIAGEHIKGFRPPLYPLVASVFYYMKLNLAGIRIFQAVISALTVPVIYLSGKKVFSRKAGMMAGILSVFYPFFIFYNGFLLTETLFIFLVTVSVYLLISLDNSAWKSIRAGIAMGLTGLCRPTMQAYLPLALLLIAFLKEPLLFRAKKIFLILFFFSLMLSPWIIRNYLVFHRFIPGTTMGGYVFWEGNNPESDGGPCHNFPENIMSVEETERDKLFYKMTFEVIRENPRRFLWLLQNKFKRFWNVIPNASDFTKPLYRITSVMSFGIMLPFFVLGFFASLKNRKAWFMHILIIFFTVFHMVFLASIRYRVAIEPFYIIFAVYGFLWLLNLCKPPLLASQSPSTCCKPPLLAKKYGEGD